MTVVPQVSGRKWRYPKGTGGEPQFKDLTSATLSVSTIVPPFQIECP